MAVKTAAKKYFIMIDGEDAATRDAIAERLASDDASKAKGAVVLTMGDMREKLYKIPATPGTPDNFFADDLNLECKRALIRAAEVEIRAGNSVILAADIKYDPMRSYMTGMGMALDYDIRGFVLDPAADMEETEYRANPIMKRRWRDIAAKDAPQQAYDAIRDAVNKPLEDEAPKADRKMQIRRKPAAPGH